MVLIFYTTHSQSPCSGEGVHGGIAAGEEEVARIGTTNRTAPVIAAEPNIVEQTIADDAVARQG